MTILDAKTFNKQRAEFNKRVRAYAINTGAHSAFTMANFIAFELLQPSKTSEFITDDDLAEKLNMHVNSIPRLRKQLIPLGLVVTPGKWKGNATEYSIGPTKPTIGDGLSDSAKPTMGDGLCTAKPTIGESRSPQSVSPKPTMGGDTLTIEDTRSKTPRERARADARAALSLGATQDSQKVEILPPEKATKPSRRRANGGTPLNQDWQPGEEDLNFATKNGVTPEELKTETQSYRDFGHATPSMTFRKWITRFIKHKRSQPNIRAEGVGLAGVLTGLTTALAAREARTKAPP